ncbi:hypothetical protein [Maribacter sp. 2307UL18-2]|uniref:hypothetical protein n=1 Tax=Maribacter sp. 2307UL18-2 TaxID=3386274 RepID=UPI0039BC4DC8
MKKKFALALCLVWCVAACKEQTPEKQATTTTETPTVEQEKAAILHTLNSETEAAFSRDYEAWQDKWVHDPTMTKIYLNFSDSTFSESVGWAEVDQFVKDYFVAHPEPEPVPELIDDIDVRLYGTGAWVVYEQQDSLRGLKRETRLMEKVEGQWKIAGMQTTIYGASKVE